MSTQFRSSLPSGHTSQLNWQLINIYAGLASHSPILAQYGQFVLPSGHVGSEKDEKVILSF